MLFGLLVRPTALVHARTYIGLSDSRYYAAELRQLREQYGGLRAVIERARAADVPAGSRRRRVCDRIEVLRAFLDAHMDADDAAAVLEELFPPDDENTRTLRMVLDGLMEDGDTPAGLYSKYIDYARAVPQDERTVRVMTLMASKGLQAEHVYIIGCNSGNMPGAKRSVHLTDMEHRQEQLRLLYVAFSRATRSLTVSWAREIPFRQARGHNTPAVRTIRRQGQRPVAVVGLCEFIQALPGITWET